VGTHVAHQDRPARLAARRHGRRGANLGGTGGGIGAGRSSRDDLRYARPWPRMACRPLRSTAAPAVISTGRRRDEAGHVRWNRFGALPAGDRRSVRCRTGPRQGRSDRSDGRERGNTWAAGTTRSSEHGPARPLLGLGSLDPPGRGLRRPLRRLIRRVGRDAPPSGGRDRPNPRATFDCVRRHLDLLKTGPYQLRTTTQSRSQPKKL
jgi:hypothetical protein